MTEDERRQYEEQDKVDGLRRRDFLQILGGSFAALAASGCGLSAPREKIVPYADKTDVTPGLARWYASTCGSCAAACGVLVKSRDGRPIKMEGNPDHPLSRGGLCARGQASVLDLYDSSRLKGPLSGESATTWEQLDAAVVKALDEARRRGKSVRVLSQTIPSPSLDAAAAEFCARHGARRVIYDSASAAAILDAHRLTHGHAVLPRYRFDQAKAVVSFCADFLGAWISPVEFTKAWSSRRRPEKGQGMAWLAQFESRMSVTGANADLRAPLRPSQELAAVVELGRLVAKRLGRGEFAPSAGSLPEPVSRALESAAGRLAAARGEALVVSGSPDPSVQAAVNGVNELLGAYGKTLDIRHPSRQRQGLPDAMSGLIAEMERGEVGALVVFGANPAYDHPESARVRAALKKVGAVVVLSQRRDETAQLAHYTATAPHALESWGDAAPVEGTYSLVQPLIAPLFDSRSEIESLLAWSGRKTSAHDFVRELWRAKVHPRAKGARNFDEFWNEILSKGAVEVAPVEGPSGAFNASALARLRPARKPASDGRFEFDAYDSVSMFDGRQANNPWLQELPDPVTKVTWGNVALFSPEDAKSLGLENGRMVRLGSGDDAVDLPACVQPGQAAGTVAAAFGYGRPSAGPIAANLPTRKLLPIDFDPPGGADVYPLSRESAVAVAVLAATSPLARTQQYDSQTVPFTGQERPLILETTLSKFNDYEVKEEPGATLWPKHEYPGHKWGMAVNLTSCTGCAACVVACQAENNVPVVGKAEVRKSREMHWIRIDRYYGGDDAESNPTVGFQPMLCQQCDDAPCETVCPVLATSHSSEGLNMQVYNRCVGTRYCANNCPYKVRRFNWFDYAHDDLLQNLALNPDVTVRQRGIMEKCTFCSQRIYAAKFTADSEGRPLKDGEIAPACAQSCPADAIVFGDTNDPDSRVSRAIRENKSYRVLEEIGTGPAVRYGVKVRNVSEEKA